MQSPGRAAEVQFFGHGDKTTEMADVHVITLASCNKAKPYAKSTIYAKSMSYKHP